MIAAFAALALVATPVQDPEGVIATAPDAARAETADELRRREAIAYATPAPRSAPTEDYPLVAWCEAFVGGHVTLGEQLASTDDLDRLIVNLGREERDKFRTALETAHSRQSAQTLAKAEAGRKAAEDEWTRLMGSATAEQRDSIFGMFFGLPGRCEHAARRITNNITTPPATLEQVGLGDATSTDAPAQ